MGRQGESPAQARRRGVYSGWPTPCHVQQRSGKPSIPGDSQPRAKRTVLSRLDVFDEEPWSGSGPLSPIPATRRSKAHNRSRGLSQFRNGKEH